MTALVPGPQATTEIGGAEALPGNPIRSIALEALRHGLNVLPPCQDGTKRPNDRLTGGGWKERQNLLATEEEVLRWYADAGRTGLGVVCGEVSGGLEMFEFEGRAVQAGLLDQFRDAADACGLGDLVRRVEAGWTHRSPSGGWNILYRCPETGPVKLARDPGLATDDGKDTLIETKGQGGYAVLPPSSGTVHGTGRPYEMVSGGYATIEDITPEERRALHDLARTFDRSPEREWAITAARQRRAPPDGGESPGDHFNREGDWATDILEPAGWVRAYANGGNVHWRRPGKRLGVSGNVSESGEGVFYNFSSSTPLEPGRAYDKFGAYARLHHGGDFDTAARTLASLGYGSGADTHADELRSEVKAAQSRRLAAETAGPGSAETHAPASGEKPTRDEPTEALRLRVRLRIKSLMDGATFILDAPTETPAVWGEGSEIWWPKGEELIICGPQGAGKTTIAQQVVLARVGLRSECLGYPVLTDDRRVLYVAADRPAQAQRSFARMVTEEDRETLGPKLAVWRGPLPFDLAREPQGLVILADEFGAGTVVIDSLKDVAVGLSDDETGSRLNNAVQLALAEGVEVVSLHHQRKAQQGGGKPKSLADVYGSVWITAGAGSVMLVWGEAGDPVVEVSHLKPPIESIGPLKVKHDHAGGVSTVVDGVDLLDFVATRPDGISAMDAAMVVFETGGPTRAQVEKARRRLDSMMEAGQLDRVGGRPGGSAGGDRTRYRLPTIAGMRPA